MKKFEELAWDVTEQEYRQDPALSYSTLAKYERTGFNGLSKLFDKLDTPSLTFGSAVDSIITGGDEEFNSRFLVADIPEVTDNLASIAKTLFTRYHEEYETISAIPTDILAEVGAECDYYAGDKYKNYRVKLIKEKCENYYKLMLLAGDKTILSSKDYQDVCNAVQALRYSPATKFYFAEDNPFDKIERIYQLKFKATFNGINYRCMSDLLIVDYKNKIVHPIDLKTSSHYEWDFHKSFVDWLYQIQARLYWRIIRDNMDRDPYFKDFELADYKFIVVNRRSLKPLVWTFHDTKRHGDLIYGKNQTIVFRDPFVIGNELQTYLEYECDTPIGISNEDPNDLTVWLNTL